MGASRTIPVRTLRDHCELLAKSVLRGQLATEAELAPWRPGGEQNADRSPAGWLRYYGQLHRFHARGEASGARSDLTPEFAEEDADGLAALRAAPHAVQIRDPQAVDGRRTVWQVHPKSLGAMLFLHARDWIVGWLAERLAILQAGGKPEDLELIARVHDELAKQYGLIIWVVTTPGPGVPFSQDAPTADLTPPHHFTLLDPVDVLRIATAHAVVNGRRLQVARALLGKPIGDEPPGSLRPSWTTFVGSLAVEMQLRPAELMWDWSLAELLLAVQSRSAVERAARTDAEARSAERGANHIAFGG